MTATTERKRRCRMLSGNANPCANEAISDDPKTIAICPTHALKSAQLLAEHNVIEMKLCPVPTITVRRRSA